MRSHSKGTFVSRHRLQLNKQILTFFTAIIITVTVTVATAIHSLTAYYVPRVLLSCCAKMLHAGSVIILGCRRGQLHVGLREIK